MAQRRRNREQQRDASHAGSSGRRVIKFYGASAWRARYPMLVTVFRAVDGADRCGVVCAMVVCVRCGGGCARFRTCRCPENKWGEFSNFYKSPIEINGTRWPTVEHFFQVRGTLWHPVAHASGASLTVHLLSVRLLTQAQKFPGTKHETLIRKARSPGEAAKMGRDRSRPLRRDWARVKEDIMLAALRAKFKQHRRLRSVLLSTGDAKLVEHTHNDRYWGA